MMTEEETEAQTNYDEERAQWFTDLRELVDTLEASGLPALSKWAFPGFVYHVSEKETMIARVKELGGKREKETNDHSFQVTRRVGPFTIRIHSARDNVCTSKVVGTEEVEEKMAIEWVTRMVDKDIIEWDCPEAILKEVSDESVV